MFFEKISNIAIIPYLKLNPLEGTNDFFIFSCFPLNSYQNYSSDMLYVFTVEFEIEINHPIIKQILTKSHSFIRVGLAALEKYQAAHQRKPGVKNVPNITKNVLLFNQSSMSKKS